MSTDESSLLSVGSARSKWEQMTLTTPVQAPPPPHRRATSKSPLVLPTSLGSAAFEAGAQGVDGQLKLGGLPAPAVVSSFANQGMAPTQPKLQPIQLIASTTTTTNTTVDPSQSSAQADIDLQALRRNSYPVTNAAAAASPKPVVPSATLPPSAGRPRPAIAKKPAHLSGVPVSALSTSAAGTPSKQTGSSDPKMPGSNLVLNMDRSLSQSVPDLPISQPDATTNNTKSPILALAAVPGQSIDERRLSAVAPPAPPAPPSLVVAPPDPALAPISSSNTEITITTTTTTTATALFVPPPFRQLSPGIPHSTTPPVPPPSRPVTPLVSKSPNPPQMPVSPNPPQPQPLAVPVPVAPATRKVSPPTLPPRNSNLAGTIPKSVALPDPTSFMPPPPLPRSSTVLVLPVQQTSVTASTPRTSSSPAPPAPPSRKLTHSISQSSLSGGGARVSPLPSPSEFSQTPSPQPIYQPQPRQALVAPLPLSQNLNISPQPHILSPSPSHFPQSPSGSQHSTPQPPQAQQPYLPPPPPQRLDYFGHLPPPARASTHDFSLGRKSSLPISNSTTLDYSSGGEDGGYDSDEATTEYTSFPDSSQANRRAPIFGGPLHEIPTKQRVEAIAVYGSILIVSAQATNVIDIHTGETVWTLTHSEIKVSVIGFKPTSDPNSMGRIVWLGSKEGHIWELDLDQQVVSNKRMHAHMAPIVAVEAVGQIMWSVSEDGKICVWEGSVNDTPKTYRMTLNFKAFCVVDDTLWLGRNRQVHVYHPTASGTEQFNITSRPIACFPLAVGKIGGDFSCAATVKRYPDQIFFGHEDGTVTVFSRSRGVALESINVSIHKITSMTAVGDNLWVGLKTGKLYVVDVSTKPWRVMKEWKGHEATVRAIAANDSSMFDAQQTSLMPVVSIGAESGVLLWDGLLKTDWIGKFVLGFTWIQRTNIFRKRHAST